MVNGKNIGLSLLIVGVMTIIGLEYVSNPPVYDYIHGIIIGTAFAEILIGTLLLMISPKIPDDEN